MVTNHLAIGASVPPLGSLVAHEVVPASRFRGSIVVYILAAFVVDAETRIMGVGECEGSQGGNDEEEGRCELHDVRLYVGGTKEYV